MTVAALPPQLSTDLIKIMEQRILAIEQRNAYLEDFINQVNASLKSFVFVLLGNSNIWLI